MLEATITYPLWLAIVGNALLIFMTIKALRRVPAIEVSLVELRELDKPVVKAIALNSGFKLKVQEDGSLDLNPYVYLFAGRLITASIDKGLEHKDKLNR